MHPVCTTCVNQDWCGQIATYGCLSNNTESKKDVKEMISIHSYNEISDSEGDLVQTDQVRLYGNGERLQETLKDLIILISREKRPFEGRV